jgi:hypothetical protein
MSTVGNVTGANFIRADLHVHTFPDGDIDPVPDLAAYVTAALHNGVRVLAIDVAAAAGLVQTGGPPETIYAQVAGADRTPRSD